VHIPSPLDTYNHFAAIFMSIWLLFQCSQVLILRNQWTQNISRPTRIFGWIYWAVIVLSTFAAATGWAISRKPDAATVQFLAFSVGAMGVTLFLCQEPPKSKYEICSQVEWYLKTAYGFNRLLQILHTAFSILFAAGVITLALQFQYNNPCITNFKQP